MSLRLTGCLRLIDGIPYLVRFTWTEDAKQVEIKVQLRDGDRVTVERPDHHDYEAAR